MGGAGGIIVFMSALVGLGLWSALASLFAAHYFLETIIESGAGNDEVQYSSEPIFDRWWKPLFCLWLLVFWTIAGSILLGPCMIQHSGVLTTMLGLLVWTLYPIGVISALHKHHWIHVVDFPIVAKLFRHYGAIAYVYLITTLSLSVCVGLLFGIFGHNFLWALPASFVLPTALLLYARHWGRLVWLTQTETPKKKKRRRSRRDDRENDAPEMEVEEVAVDEIREGLPRTFPRAYQESAEVPIARLADEMHDDPPLFPDGVPEMVPVDPHAAEATQPIGNPLSILADSAPEQEPPIFDMQLDETPEESAYPISIPLHGEVPKPPPELPLVDEWTVDDKPYGVIEEEEKSAATVPTTGYEQELADAEKPISLADYYDDRHDKEIERKQKTGVLPFLPPGKKAPTFETALVSGVWLFMIYPRTLQVWTNLVALTIVELVFLYLVVRFWPALD